MAWHQLCSETRRLTRCARPASAWRPTPRLRRRIRVSSTPTKLPTRILVHIGSRATLSTSRLFLFTCLSRSSISFSLLSKVFVSLFFSRSTFFLSLTLTQTPASLFCSLSSSLLNSPSSLLPNFPQPPSSHLFTLSFSPSFLFVFYCLVFFFLFCLLHLSHGFLFTIAAQLAFHHYSFSSMQHRG